MTETQNHSLGSAAADRPSLFALLAAHARDPEDRVRQQELLNALYPSILPILDRVMAKAGCGTCWDDELLDRVRVRAIEKCYLLRNPCIQHLLAAPPSGKTEAELSVAIISVVRNLAYWEAARLRRRAVRVTSIDASDSLDHEFEQLAAQVYRTDAHRRTIAETIRETLARMNVSEKTWRLALYLLQEATQQEIAALEGTHQATVSRSVTRLKRELKHALQTEIER